MKSLVVILSLFVFHTFATPCTHTNGCPNGAFVGGSGNSGPTKWTPSHSGTVDHITIHISVVNSASSSQLAKVGWEFDFIGNGNPAGTAYGDTGVVSWSVGSAEQTLVLTAQPGFTVTKGGIIKIDEYLQKVTYDIQVGSSIAGGGGNLASSLYTSTSTCDGTFNGNAWIQVVINCPAGTSGDPHFYGFKGQKYDIMGQSYEIYNLVTSPVLQINSRFNPYFRLPNQIVPTGTMMGELGIKISSHRLFLNSNSTVAILDNLEVSLESDWTMNYDNTILSNLATKSGYEITIKNSDLAITFIRKVYRHSGLEAQWHYDYKATLLNNNPEMHGLLGQTWEKKEFADKGDSPFQFLDGSEEDYRIQNNDIFGVEFTFNKFQNL